MARDVFDPSLTPAVFRTAPRGQYRVLAVDTHTGLESVEADYWEEHEAHEHIYEIWDDRPWMDYFTYDDPGQEHTWRR